MPAAISAATAAATARASSMSLSYAIGGAISAQIVTFFLLPVAYAQLGLRAERRAARSAREAANVTAESRA